MVDTGLHAKRWTPRAGACASSSTRTAPRPSEVRERGRPLLQLAGPGLRLQGRPQRDQPPARPGARRRSGARYDLKAFNDAVVIGGNVPMDVLAKNVDDYIASGEGHRLEPVADPDSAIGRRTPRPIADHSASALPIGDGRTGPPSTPSKRPQPTGELRSS